MNRRSGIKSKKKILGAAMKVFSRCGYAGASIREIARAADISIGGVYLYFKNKEELYLSLIKDRIDEVSHKTKEIGESKRSPAEALSAFLDIHLEYAMKHKELILIHIRERGFTFGMEMKRQFFNGQISLLEKIIREGLSKSEFRECNAEEVAKIIMGTLRGIVLSMAIEGERVITAKGLGELILNGLLKSSNKKSVDISRMKRGSRGNI